MLCLEHHPVPVQVPARLALHRQATPRANYSLMLLSPPLFTKQYKDQSRSIIAGDAVAKATEKAGDDKGKAAAEAEAAPKPVVKPRRDRKVLIIINNMSNNNNNNNNIISNNNNNNNSNIIDVNYNSIN